MIYTVTLNPAVDKTVEIPGFQPGQVNRIAHARLDPGGKGVNVSRTLRALGEPTVALGLAAGRAGAWLQAQLEAAGIPAPFCFVPGETRTNLKIIDPFQGQCTDVNEPGPPASPEACETLLKGLMARIAPGDIAVLAGKLPAGAPPDLFACWCRRLHALGARVYLDTEGPALAQGLAAGPDCVKPNGEELAALLGRPIPDAAAAAKAALALTRQGVGLAAVSLGAQGAVFAAPGGLWRGHSARVPVASAVGAGDAMLAALALGEARGLPLPERCRLALAVSAAAVARPGTQPPDPALVQRLLPQVRLEPLDAN